MEEFDKIHCLNQELYTSSKKSSKKKSPISKSSKGKSPLSKKSSARSSKKSKPSICYATKKLFRRFSDELPKGPGAFYKRFEKPKGEHNLKYLQDIDTVRSPRPLNDQSQIESTRTYSEMTSKSSINSYLVTESGAKYKILRKTKTKNSEELCEEKNINFQVICRCDHGKKPLPQVGPIESKLKHLRRAETTAETSTSQGNSLIVNSQEKIKSNEILGSNKSSPGNSLILNSQENIKSNEILSSNKSSPGNSLILNSQENIKSNEILSSNKSNNIVNALPKLHSRYNPIKIVEMKENSQYEKVYSIISDKERSTNINNRKIGTSKFGRFMSLLKSLIVSQNVNNNKISHKSEFSKKGLKILFVNNKFQSI